MKKLGTKSVPLASMRAAVPPSRALRWLLALTITSVVACGDPEPETPPAASTTTSSGGEAAAGDFAESTTRFGLDLYRALAEGPGNVAISPASVATAMTMTWGGARGETASEMQATLHLGEGSHESAGALLRRWNDPNREAYVLRVANRLFVQTGYDLDPTFVTLQRDTYEAPLTPVDFRAATEPARAEINEWVAGRTEQRIPEILPAGSLTVDTRLVVTNAVYFHGRWSHPFDAERTADAPFHLSADEAVEVPTMAQVVGLRYAADDDAAVLELPYDGEDLSMVVILPNEAGGLGELERTLDASRLQGWIGALEERRVSVRLPRFRVAAPPVALEPALSALGIHQAFSPESADLSGIASPTVTGEPPLFIDDVYHRAFVDVNEEGTEAAAATAVVVATRRAPPPATPFHVDRPFLWLIRDASTGALLFIGRVVDPRG